MRSSCFPIGEEQLGSERGGVWVSRILPRCSLAKMSCDYNRLFYSLVSSEESNDVIVIATGGPFSVSSPPPGRYATLRLQ